MAGKEVVPTLGLESFSCPHPDCGALAHQTWFKLYARGYDDNEGPFLPNEADMVRMRKDKEIPAATMESIEAMASKKILFETHTPDTWVRTELVNIYVSRCYSCERLAVWRADELIYPSSKISVAPTEGMPEDVRTVFLEANEIVDKSPKGAAALLRLCIQKLMPHIGERGDNINGDIASLVQKGLDTKIQRALDVVRVVGNHAVHPGLINLDDNKTIATQLFHLVNVIVETQITQKNHIDAIFASVVPETEKVKIEKRDAPKQIVAPKKNST